MTLTPWLIKCASGREFIVYAADRDRAGEFFERRMPHEAVEAYSLAPYVAGSVTVFLDERKAPGA